MTPDYLHFRLSGGVSQEYTIASTTGLLDAVKREWSRPLLEHLGLPGKVFGPLSPPGTILGTLGPEIREQVGYDCQVVLPAAHDTGSAFLAIPGNEGIYLSSGTWSLIGIESSVPFLTPEAREANFSNEGGYGFRYRFLKNITGLWIIQSIRKELGESWSFADLQREAEAVASPWAEDAGLEVNAPELLAPESMIEAIKNQCRERGLRMPQTIGELMDCVYRSLALCYREAVREIEAITGKTYGCLHIVGGGSQDRYLNRLSARACGIPVYAGPVECAVLGNLIAQMITAGEFPDVEAARAAVAESFPLEEYGI
jgi:rhamnulokinase